MHQQLTITTNEDLKINISIYDIQSARDYIIKNDLKVLKVEKHEIIEFPNVVEYVEVDKKELGF